MKKPTMHGVEIEIDVGNLTRQPDVEVVVNDASVEIPPAT